MFPLVRLGPSQELVDNCVYDGLDVQSFAGGAVERVRGRGGSVVPGKLALATRSELYGVVLGDVSVPPEVEPRALGVLLGQPVLGHQAAQPMVSDALHQHQTLLDQVLDTYKYRQSLDTIVL